MKNRREKYMGQRPSRYGYPGYRAGEPPIVTKSLVSVGGFPTKRVPPSQLR